MTIPRARPLYFGPADQPLFGWLHQPVTLAPGDIGVLFCSPFGNESVCVHRTYRHCAERIAEAGIPAMRFDYRGTGNSAGDDTDAGQVAGWISAVHSGIAALREQTGVRAVCLVGVRLGATIAMLVAQESVDVSALIAIAPVVSGRRYLRELRALAFSRAPPYADTRPDPAGTFEVAGFALTAETQAAIQAIDLRQVASVHCRAALVMQRDDLTADSSLVPVLNQLGVTTEEKAFHGYVEMMLDPHKTEVPTELLDGILAWLKSLNRRAPAHGQIGEAPGPADRVAVARIACADGQIVLESARFLDESCGLFAIVTEPSVPCQHPPEENAVLILPNSGAVHHIGPNRLYVMIARTLASLGFTVVRFDISGLGESPARSQQPENVTYPPTAVPDIELAVSFARSLFGSRQIHLAGICSGGYHSLKAAAAGIAFRSITVINPLTFYWKEGMELTSADAYVVTAEAKRYRESARSLASWLKLLRGQVHVGNFTAIAYRRIAARCIQVRRALCRSVGIPLRDDLARELRDIAATGTALHFVFSESDPGYAMLKEQAGRAVGRLQARRQLRIEVIAGADHTFTQRSSHSLLIGQLRASLAQVA